MDARMERYEMLAAMGSALIDALITALAVPLAAEGAVASGAPPAAVVQTQQGPAASR